jgi:2-polyprenyl-3-methyl-5-hydroxy-6-metoxy-1,4-benzoquinol methylase
MSSEHLATAYQAWERNWTTEEERARWLAPHPLVQKLVPVLQSRGLNRVLDVGCGIGRHARYLAQHGFSCVGVDASESGLEFARAEAERAGVHVEYRVGTFYELDFGAARFDALVAWNVIYHGDRDIARRATDEFARVLVPGGLYVGTMLSKRNAGYGVGREVRRDTFVVDDATNDHIHPHLYVNSRDLLELHPGFEVIELEDVEQAPGHHHWQYLLERT